MLMEIQCLARPVGTPEDRYKHVDAAIAVVQASGLRYEVGALKEEFHFLRLLALDDRPLGARVPLGELERVQAQARAVTVAGQSLPEVLLLPVHDTLAWLGQLGKSLTPNDRKIADEMFAQPQL